MTTIQDPWDGGMTETLEEQSLEDALEEEFLELICSDDDLVAAEFEAIIAAEWPTPPPARPPLRRPVDPTPTPGDRRWRQDSSGRLASRPRHPGVGGWARQRSPPQ